MLYAAQIDVPNRAVWGNVHSLELLLPSKIRKINGFLTNAVLGSRTRLKRCYTNRFSNENNEVTTQTTYIFKNPDETIREEKNPSQELVAELVAGGCIELARFDEPAVQETLERQPISSQIGVVSLSLNNTQIIADSTPLCVSQHLNKQGIVPNTILLPKPEDVRGGSFLRIIIEEQQLSPFITAAEWGQMGDVIREGYYNDYDHENPDKFKPENGYTAKIYLNYD
ncbi:MAG: hypothetical protein IJ911_09755 [Salinivirgaceae bacterium]|nr:hypothetical protein [Salinivirgaceae bacterium]